MAISTADKVTATVGEEMTPPTATAAYAIIHYFRTMAIMATTPPAITTIIWGLHLWGDAIDPAKGPIGPAPSRFWVKMNTAVLPGSNWPDPTQPLNFIIHRGDTKDGTDADRFYNPASHPEIWVQTRRCQHYTSQAEARDT